MSEWIEIKSFASCSTICIVSLFMSEWIEITVMLSLLYFDGVSLFMSEWIEINSEEISFCLSESHSL